MESSEVGSGLDRCRSIMVFSSPYHKSSMLPSLIRQRCFQATSKLVLHPTCSRWTRWVEVSMAEEESHWFPLYPTEICLFEEWKRYHPWKQRQRVWISVYGFFHYVVVVTRKVVFFQKWKGEIWVCGGLNEWRKLLGKCDGLTYIWIWEVGFETCCKIPNFPAVTWQIIASSSQNTEVLMFMGNGLISFHSIQISARHSLYPIKIRRFKKLWIFILQ